MIIVDQVLCSGCGTCVDECPTGAITLKDDIARVDADRCDGCSECVHVCPNQALAWIPEPVLETVVEPSSLTVIQPPVEVIHVETKRPVPWRRSIFPMVGGALGWAGRELAPRLALLTLDALEAALDRRLSRRPADENAKPIRNEGGCGEGKQRRHRHRRGRSQD
jgi:NAD-dependent dihydropyrimidine dehydrogenase PreA subunit